MTYRNDLAPAYLTNLPLSSTSFPHSPYRAAPLAFHFLKYTKLKREMKGQKNSTFLNENSRKVTVLETE